jgi:hypothetical protein
MKLPRDLSGDDLAQALTRLGYRITRQTGAIFAWQPTNQVSITSRSRVTIPSVSGRSPPSSAMLPAIMG